MSNRDRIPAVSMTEQRRPENAQNRSQGGFRQPMHFVGSQQRQPLQQAGRGIEQKVIKKEDIPRLNSTPKEVKQVGVECVSPYDEEEWVNIGKEKKVMKPQDVQYAQALKPPYHLASFLKMAGNSTKGTSSTVKNTLVFAVMQG